MSSTLGMSREAARQIEMRSREFERHFAARNAVALVNCYFAPDAEQPTAYPPGRQPPVRGRAALENLFAAQFEVIRAIRLDTIRVLSSGAMAFEIGRAHLTLVSGDAAVGRYVVLWQETQGEWRATIDFFAEDGWVD